MSVVVPHYNYGRYLPVAVNSTLNQRGVDIEVIIVDDASTDGSIETARAIANADPRVTLIEHTENLGHIRTYNDGLSRATSEYVVLLSADDALTPGSLARSVALLESHPEVALAYGAVHWFDDTFPPHRHHPSWWQLWSGEEWIGRLAERGRNAIVNPEVVMRRSVFSEIGGYDPEFPHAGDMHMWLQAAARGAIGFVGGPRQAGYRDHGANMHATDYAGLLDDMGQVRQVYERFFSHDGKALDKTSKLVVAARQAVAREALLRGILLVAGGMPHETLSTCSSFAMGTTSDVTRTALWQWARYVTKHAGNKRIMWVAKIVETTRWSYRSRRHRVFGF